MGLERCDEFESERKETIVNEYDPDNHAVEGMFVSTVFYNLRHGHS
jgi:hypothetical protein